MSPCVFTGENVSLLISAAIPSAASVQQQQPGRPTQQVQPVSSHFEEATGHYCNSNTTNRLEWHKPKLRSHLTI